MLNRRSLIQGLISIRRRLALLGGIFMLNWRKNFNLTRIYVHNESSTYSN